jgi:type IV pilus assembly protein PilF
MITVLSCLTVLAAGCVTEGGLAVEPASDEEQAQANLALGIGYLREQRPDFAIDALQRALDLEPRMAAAHSAIAVAYDQTGELELAEQHHRRATQLAPSDPIPQNAFAVFLCRQDRWSDAEPYFRTAIDDATNGGVSYMINAATCAGSAGDLEAAEDYYRAALASESESVDALRGMVDISVAQENFLQGRAFWQRLERSGSLAAGDLLSCFVIERALGDDLAATDCADRLRREFPGTPALRQLRTLEQNGG